MNLRFCSPGRMLPYIFYLALAFVLLLCWRPAHAQQNANRVKPMQVGDQVPDVLIKRIENYKTSEAQISDFNGKLLVLDFWASWCGACISMLPRIDSLQRQFDDKIQILPVAYQSSEVINDFLDRYQKKRGGRIVLPEVMSDTLLHALFPHTYLPHYVWISTEGKVLSITGMEEMTAENIQKVLDGQANTIRQKVDGKAIAYDTKKPLFINGNGGDGKNIVYHSVLSGYTDGLVNSGYTIMDDSIEVRIGFRNTTLQSMFQVAYSDNGYLGKNRVILNVNTPSKLTSTLTGQSYNDWRKQGNAFCYEVKMPPHRRKEAHEIMKQDFARFFNQYKAGMQKRNTTCLVLKRTDDIDRIKTKGGKSIMSAQYGQFTLQNKNLLFLVSQLNVISMQNSPYPVIDGTGYSEPVDLMLDANLSDVADLNKALKAYGLALVEEVREIDMLVIADNI
ncbi:TlpA family protein disulfide reductase [Dyadobacter sp. CY312]|uniref:TlpA family protein disulfide reductase n=1 Tax=Dyadobacter sp. CY312 TaxID=2907303 RepID=UPI001F1A8325|nr:TlpA family protein disulfide reductase [Dyadobacter sp. CY312]MCE7044459.1 TlpA family protein disulfide reductase [Dyadobacter sp. CY312]